MKNTLKASIKILALCFALTLVNCEKDDTTNVVEPKQELIFEKIYFNELT